MAITSRPEDKYAFLFSGSTDARYLEDLKNVFKTITEYYNYPIKVLPVVPVGNIWVVSGDSALLETDFPGANLVNISSVAELESAFNSFAHAASTPAPSDMNTALLYFTGGGSFGTLHLDKDGSETIDNAWLTARINGTYNGNKLGLKCHLNVVMQQSYSGGFVSALSDAIIVQQWSFTSACGSGETVDTDGNDTYGSFFTYAWTMGLQLQKIPSTAKYADELTPIGDQFIVSIRQARDFAVEYCGEVSALNISSNTLCTMHGDSQQYLGKPAFLIRNGETQWWESPDIYITNSEYSGTDNDIYVTGEDNTIHVNIKNSGTHPVRSFWLGVNHFGTGFSATDFRYCKNFSKDHTGAQLPLSDIIKAGDEYLHDYDMAFDVSETHDYIVARTTLLQIVEDTLNTPADFNPPSLEAEARRNLDLYDSTPVVNKEVSPYQEEKFALLFSGSTADRYKKDIENVYTTLVDYYNFLPDQIWVVLGETGNDPNCPGLPTASNLIHVANKTQLENVLDPDDISKFITKVSTLRAEIVTTNFVNTAVAYITGKGNTGDLEIVGDGSIVIQEDEAWFSEKLNTITMDNCFLHLIMQQDYCQNFHVNDLEKLTCRGSITYASAYDQANSGSAANGSYFTEAWCKALQMEVLPAGTTDAGEYADELGGGAESTNLLVSLREAQLYAQQIIETIPSSIISSHINQNLSNDPNYLGKPAFLIRDGDMATPPDNIWESPDIYLTHPPPFENSVSEPDYYIQDLDASCNNIINVETRNFGTHPVRKFALGVIRFHMGGGGLGVKRNKIEELVNAASDKLILCPVPFNDPIQNNISTTQVRSCVTTFDDIPFDTQTHRCVRAKADLLEVTDVDLDNWSWTIRYNEAQRNIDYSGVTSVSEPPPLPGEGGIPEGQDKIPDNGDDAEANEKMKKNLQGFKEHIYEIRNPFREKNRFILVFPEVLIKYRDQITTEWFELTNELDKRMRPLEIIKKPYEHIQFILEPKESKKILFYLALKPKKHIKEIINLPFEILVDVKQHRVDFTNIKKTTYKKLQSEFALFSGFTVKIKTDAGKLFGIVQDKKGNLVANAMICIQTVNTRQGAIIRTSRKGTYAFSEINPDVYRVMAVTKNWHTRRKLIYLPGGERGMKGVKLDFYEKESIPGQPVRIILDRIRILNDHDPILKGKGELTFTTVVIPDKNDKKKQVRHLPEKGVYRVSDKRGKNDIDLGVTIFEGSVSELLSIGISGKEIDFFDRNDDLSRYYRFFRGDPNKWYGKYQPGDERFDKENVGDWQVWYRIVRF